MKKLILILLPVLVLGTIAGLALTGVINIPGLSPAKKPQWETTLKTLFKKFGKVQTDAVVMTSIPKADFDSFVAAANQGGFKPKVAGERVVSESLVAYLKSGDAVADASPSPTPSPNPIPTTSSPPKPVVASPTADPRKGAATVAALWNGIEVGKLVKITANYKDDELAKILILMDTDQVAELLSKLGADRAAKLSRELQKQGAIIPS